MLGQAPSSRSLTISHSVSTVQDLHFLTERNSLDHEILWLRDLNAVLEHLGLLLRTPPAVVISTLSGVPRRPPPKMRDQLAGAVLFTIQITVCIQCGL